MTIRPHERLDTSIPTVGEGKGVTTELHPVLAVAGIVVDEDAVWPRQQMLLASEDGVGH